MESGVSQLVGSMTSSYPWLVFIDKSPVCTLLLKGNFATTQAGGVRLGGEFFLAFPVILL